MKETIKTTIRNTEALLKEAHRLADLYYGRDNKRYHIISNAYLSALKRGFVKDPHNGLDRWVGRYALPVHPDTGGFYDECNEEELINVAYEAYMEGYNKDLYELAYRLLDLGHDGPVVHGMGDNAEAFVLTTLYRSRQQGIHLKAISCSQDKLESSQLFMTCVELLNTDGRPVTLTYTGASDDVQRVYTHGAAFLKDEQSDWAGVSRLVKGMAKNHGRAIAFVPAKVVNDLRSPEIFEGLYEAQLLEGVIRLPEFLSEGGACALIFDRDAHEPVRLVDARKFSKTNEISMFA